MSWSLVGRTLLPRTVTNAVTPTTGPPHTCVQLRLWLTRWTPDVCDCRVEGGGGLTGCPRSSGTVAVSVTPSCRRPASTRCGVRIAAIGAGVSPGRALAAPARGPSRPSRSWPTLATAVTRCRRPSTACRSSSTARPAPAEHVMQADMGGRAVRPPRLVTAWQLHRLQGPSGRQMDVIGRDWLSAFAATAASVAPLVRARPLRPLAANLSATAQALGWKWQLKKGPLRPREKGPPVGSVSTSTLLRHSETAHPAPPAGEPAVPDPNPEPAVPVRCGVRSSVARRVPGTLWTVGTHASRPGRKAHNCHPSRGAGGVSPEGP